MSDAKPVYLITGATGFLGRHILRSLQRISPESRVVILVRDTSSWENQSWREEAGGVAVVAGSVLNVDQWKNDQRLAHLDGIFHLAAVVKHTRAHPEEMIRTNVDGAVNMVRLAAEKTCRVIFASTSGTVACSTRPGDHGDEDAPYSEEVAAQWPYYLSKIRAEKEARALAARLAVELVIVRPPVMLGPGDHRFRSTSYLLRLMRGKLPFIPKGEMHFADIRDVADAMVRAMLLAKPRPIYHLPGHVSTLDEFFRAVAGEAGIERTWKVIPGWLALSIAKINDATARIEMIPDPVVIEMASRYWGTRSRYAEADLGYRPRAAAETLRDSVRWIRAHHPAFQPAARSP